MMAGAWPHTKLVSSEDERANINARREALRVARRCVNGPLVGDVSRSGRVHGEAYKGGRCRNCWERKNGAAS